MSAKRHVMALIGLSLMAVAGPVEIQAADSLKHRGASTRLEGTFQVQATFIEPTLGSVKVLFTFMPGRSDDEGTLVDTNEFQVTPNPICTPDQGAWKRTGPREFVATHYNFCFDQTSNPPGNPAGTTTIRTAIRLSPDGRDLVLRQHVEGFDREGNLVFVGDLDGQGTRVEAEGPPQ